MTGPEEKDSEITGGRKKCMRQEEERFFQIIFEKNSHVLFRYICGQLNNDRETAKDVLNDVWEVLVVKFETVADLEGEEMTKWLFCVAKNKIKNQRRKHYYQNEVSYTQYQKAARNRRIKILLLALILAGTAIVAYILFNSKCNYYTYKDKVDTEDSGDVSYENFDEGYLKYSSNGIEYQKQFGRAER